MKADLEAAAQVQEALLPPAGTTIPGVRLAWSFRPCEHLAGDTLNAFSLGRDHVGLYLLDVSGHGVPAALLSVHLSLILSPVRDPSSFLVHAGKPVPPAQVVGALNRRFALLNTERFFTLFYGVLDRRDGTFDYAWPVATPDPRLRPAAEKTAASSRPRVRRSGWWTVSSRNTDSA